jgi:hypothetical protein
MTPPGITRPAATGSERHERSSMSVISLPSPQVRGPSAAIALSNRGERLTRESFPPDVAAYADGCKRCSWRRIAGRQSRLEYLRGSAECRLGTHPDARRSCRHRAHIGQLRAGRPTSDTSAQAPAHTSIQRFDRVSAAPPPVGRAWSPSRPERGSRCAHAARSELNRVHSPPRVFGARDLKT